MTLKIKNKESTTIIENVLSFATENQYENGTWLFLVGENMIEKMYNEDGKLERENKLKQSTLYVDFDQNTEELLVW